jgi:hypothetical protein
MIFMKHLLFPLCAFAVALAGAGSASATAITTPGLTVTSGGLTFTNFTCAFTSSGAASGACASFDVTALAPPPPGIQFSSALSVLNVASADAALTFNVASTSAISAVGLSFNSNFLGLDVNSVTEDVYTAQGGTLVGTATVFCGTVTGCAATTVDDVTLNGSYTSLYITKDINLSGFAAGAFGSISIIQQTFTSATPEPISVSLIGGGLALFGLARLRKSKS